MTDNLNSIKSEGHVLKQETRKPTTLRLPLNSNNEPVGEIDGGAAGTVILFNDEPQLIVDRIIAPCLDNIEGMIEVTGDSMSPTYPSGSRIALSRLHDLRVLVWGFTYYIIDKNLQGTLKRIHPPGPGYPNTIKLVSDHPDQIMFPPIHRSWDDILAVLRIIACIIKQ